MQNPLSFTIASAKDFFLKEISLSVISIQVWMLLALALVAVLLVLVIVSSVINSKKHKQGLAEEGEEQNSSDEKADEREETASAEETATVEETEVQETTVSEETVEEVAVTEEPVEETVEETTAPVEETVEEATAPVEETVEEPAEEVPTVEEPAEETVEETATVEEEETETEEVVATEEPVEETVATVVEERKGAVGKFEICNSPIGGFRYVLRANNGQILYESKDYKAFATCADAIEKFRNSVVNGEFLVRADKFDNYRYQLKSATSNNVIYLGESYASKNSCLNSVESVKRFAPNAVVVDGTDPDFQVTEKPFEVSKEVASAVEAKQGAVGKWVIGHVDADDETSPYCFTLYANNGQPLFESRDFATLLSCRKGIDTFVSTLKNGYFIISADKSGRYKFLLRSKKTGSQAEYAGPNYSDRTSCANSVISVYKFGLLTPINVD